MTNFTDVVNFLTADTFATFIATKNGLKASKDLYHFQMAINEHGEVNVVNETALVLHERYRCSYAEAASMAAHRVQAMLELVSGENTFQDVRKRLNK